MKKFNLFLIGLSMILMSCENVQEKSEQFKQEFATAITNGKFEDAERIANDAQTYYEGLSDSNKKNSGAVLAMFFWQKPRRFF